MECSPGFDMTRGSPWPPQYSSTSRSAGARAAWPNSTESTSTQLCPTIVPTVVPSIVMRCPGFRTTPRLSTASVSGQSGGSPNSVLSASELDRGTRQTSSPSVRKATATT